MRRVGSEGRPSQYRLVLFVVAGAALAALVAAAWLAPAPRPAAAAGPGVLIQQISSDPYTDPVTQHETEVEPDTFAYGSTIVSAFQVGRFYYGAANNIGWATSTDGGDTWTNGLLPGMTGVSSLPGPYFLVSDPTVAYDATHGVWLISALVISITGEFKTGFTVSRSTDGLNWDPPVEVIPPAAPPVHDKEWMVCDNGSVSPFAGRCYVTWTDTSTFRIYTNTSTDGGLTWGPAVASVDNAVGTGTQPVVQPDGTLIVVYCCMRAIRSTDGGASFGPFVTISDLQFHFVAGGLRAPPFPSVEVDANGTVYVAWPDCRFRAGCSAGDIVMSTSSDGLAWSPVTRLPIDGVTSGVDYFIPGLAVDPTTKGASAKLALTYYYYNDTACTSSTCELHVGFVSSEDGGGTWSLARPLNPEAMSLSWLADTSQGRMVGDYISTSFAGGRAVAVLALASQPDPSFHEAMYAATIDLSVDPVADNDGDGCTDQQENGPNAAAGGQRDYLNPWDYFNPTGDRINRIDDIVAVVNKFGHDQGVFQDYDTRYDRTELVGGNPWQFGPPDGTIRVFDIIAAVRSFGHDCA